MLLRAYVAHHSINASDAPDALSELASPSFDPWTSVIIEGGGARGRTSGESTEARIVEARVVSYEPQRVVIETDDSQPGYLVLTDTFYPGWKAQVDGRSVAIERANYLFRAVPVDAGTHRVTFVYEPTPFKAGVSLMLAAVVVSGGFLWRGRRRKPNPA